MTWQLAKRLLCLDKAWFLYRNASFLLRHMGLGISRPRFFGEEAFDQRKNSNVLIATCCGGHQPSLLVEATLASSLLKAGHAVSSLLCDGAIDACMMCEQRAYSSTAQFLSEGASRRCYSCHMLGNATYQRSGVDDRHVFGKYLCQDDYREVNCFVREINLDNVSVVEYRGINVLEHALAGALRFLAVDDLSDVELGRAVLRKYLVSACLTVIALERLLTNRKFDVLVINHGIYTPQGVVADIARLNGIRVVTWHRGYRESTFIFSHKDTYHKTLLGDSDQVWRSIGLSPRRKIKIVNYLKSRRAGSADWISFLRNPHFDKSDLSRRYNLNFDGMKTVCLLSNVCWDAQVHYDQNIFSNMFDWIRDTIEFYAGNPAVQLVIRAHPAEITGTIPSQKLVHAEIKKWYYNLPSNVIVIPSSDPVDTYELINLSDCCIIYGTKMGVEIAPLGIPVVVAGEAWVRGKNLTFDAKSIDHYHDLLVNLEKNNFDCTPNDFSCHNALRYAYYFFFKRMILVDFFVKSKLWPGFKIDRSIFGNKTGGEMDGWRVILDGIIHGKDFIWDVENLTEETPIKKLKNQTLLNENSN